MGAGNCTRDEDSGWSGRHLFWHDIDSVITYRQLELPLDSCLLL